MNREQLVEDVVKAAMRLALIQDESGVVHNEGSPIADLRVAARALRAFDAEKPKALKWGAYIVQAADRDWNVQTATHYLAGGEWCKNNCDYEANEPHGGGIFTTESEALAALDACQTPPPGYVEPTLNNNDGSPAPIEQDGAKVCNVAASEYRTVTDPATILAVLYRLPVGAKVRIDTDFPGESFRNQEASVYQSAGGGRYAEWRHGALYQASIALTSLTYRLADDPQAMPAGETKHVGVDLCDVTRSEFDAQKARADTHHGLITKLYEYKDALAARVAELERAIAGLAATLNTTSAEANGANIRISGVESLMREAESWLSLCAHRLASETPKVGEPSRADLLAVCAKIGKATREQPLTVAEVGKANKDVPLGQRVDEFDVWASSMTDIVAALRRDVEANAKHIAEEIRTRQEAICEAFAPLQRRIARLESTPTPSPKPLPFGCVAHQHEDGRWTIKNKGLTHYWDHVQNEWMADTSPEDGGFNSDTEALYYFHATNVGKVPPPDHKPASEGRYEVVPYGITASHVVRKSDGKVFSPFNQWTKTEGIALPNDIALAVAAALESQP